MAFNYYNLDTDQDISIDGYVPITVMANFRKDGKFIPMKAQIIEEDERITLDLTVRRSADNKDRIVYDCYYTRNGVKLPISIIYFIKRHLWVIPSPKA